MYLKLKSPFPEWNNSAMQRHPGTKAYVLRFVLHVFRFVIHLQYTKFFTDICILLANLVTFPDNESYHTAFY